MGLLPGRLHRGQWPARILGLLVTTSYRPVSSEWTSPEIAEEFDVPYWRVHSALKQLRKHRYVEPSGGWRKPVRATPRGCEELRRHMLRIGGVL